MSGDGTANAPISGAIPAGWYPDPGGSNGTRWWDGSGWTENVREPEPVAAPSTFNSFVHAEFRPSIPVPIAESGIAYTRSSWWLASSPLWVVAPQAAVVEAFNALAPPPFWALLLGITLLTLLAWAILAGLAFADRAGLRSGGNLTAASPWWILLTPLVYLIVRARQVNLYATGGWASVIWWCIAAFVSPGVAALTIFAVYGLV
jgi:hypothetical protein